jgi:hypothetical protein
VREKKIQLDQQPKQPGGPSATPLPRNIPVFDCDVSLYAIKNELWVIRN